MARAKELRQQAERYRRLIKQINDPAALRAICDVAGELDMTAEELERHLSIRERAHALWVEHGSPVDQDLDFWLAAEREVDIQRRQ